MNYNLVNAIGNSPLIHLNRLGVENIYVKLEKTNPAGSIKDRAAYYMLKSAIDSGDLKPGMTVIEPTSGNMGIALAMLGSQLGLKVILVMPDTMSVERRNLIKAYGAELLLTPGAEGMIGAEQKLQNSLLIKDISCRINSTIRTTLWHMKKQPESRLSILCLMLPDLSQVLVPAALLPE